MPRGKGQKRYVCFCKLPSCGKNFKATREDAKTCSVAHRKALNRLLGGGDDERHREEDEAVTEIPDGPCRIFLNGRWIATKPSRLEAERAIAGWLQDWDGEFEVVAVKPKVKR